MEFSQRNGCSDSYQIACGWKQFFLLNFGTVWFLKPLSRIDRSTTHLDGSKN
jgi:hypothetical protein